MTHAADRQADQTDKEIKKTYEQARKLADKVAKNRNDWCGFDLKCQLVWKGFEFNLRAFPKDLHDLYLQLAVGLGSLGWGEELLAADNLDVLKQLLLRFDADESGALDLDAVRRSFLKLFDRRAEEASGAASASDIERIVGIEADTDTPATIGTDPAVSPGDAWEWKGSGSPDSGKGSWVNRDTNEYLHPDLEHPGPIRPHWDYRDSSDNEWRIFLNGEKLPKDQRNE